MGSTTVSCFARIFILMWLKLLLINRLSESMSSLEGLVFTPHAIHVSVGEVCSN
ncbi:hypothetical protein Hdeb2414_s0001g00018901 [Helianthus debilis subsp. tardiflorus]